MQTWADYLDGHKNKLYSMLFGMRRKWAGFLRFSFGWQVPGGMIRPLRTRGQYARSAPPLFGFGPASSVGIARDERQGVVRRGAGRPPQSAKRIAGLMAFTVLPVVLPMQVWTLFNSFCSRVYAVPYRS